MEDVPKAMKSHPRNTVSLMFENDTPVSFSFGPDMGANVNLGKMVIVDVYDERYLVGHSVINGELSQQIQCIKSSKVTFPECKTKTVQL